MTSPTASPTLLDSAELKACMSAIHQPQQSAWLVAVLTCVVESLLEHHPHPAAVRATLRRRLAALHEDVALNDARGEGRAAMDRFTQALIAGALPQR